MNKASSSGSDARRACLVAVPEVLETMFFEPLADVPDVGTLPELSMLDASRVDFEGSTRGHVVVAASAEQTASLAESFLALEDQDAPAGDVGLVLGELANMVCGSVLGHYRPDGIFRLSTPVTQLGRPAAELNEPGVTWVRFPLDRGPLFVGLTMEADG